MFRKIEEFVLPFEGKLRADNRWVKLSKIIPWDTIEDRYAKLFTSNRGQVAKPVRMALGVLLIQEKCGYSDRETVEQITENPYLQYFISLREYPDKPPFDPSLMVLFRKHFNAEKGKENDDSKPEPPSGGNKAGESTNPERKDSSFETYRENQGKLILGATCAPADIRYPTEFSLLNEAREKLDDIIDILHKNLGKQGKRPRTYRQIARKAYLGIVRNKKPGKKAIRKAIGKLLRFVRRNLGVADRLLSAAGDRHGLSRKHQETLHTIHTVYGFIRV